MEIPDISLDFWAILFLLAGAQACFLSLLILISQKEKGRSPKYLAAFLFLFGYMLIFNFCYWTNYLYRIPHLFLSILPLNYVFGPLLLLYFDSQRIKSSYQKYWYLHFLAACLIVLHLSPFYILDAETKLLILNRELSYPEGLLPQVFGYLNSPIIFGIYMLIYFFWKIKLILRLHTEDKELGRSHELILIRRRWFLLLLSLYAAFMCSYLLYYLIAGKDFFSLSYDYAISGVMTLSTYSLAYLGIKRSFIFSVETKAEEVSNEKYRSSSLSKGASSSLAREIHEYMQKEKPYLDNALRLKDLAEQLSISPHHLSQLINEKFEKSFNQFINEYRVTDAKALLANLESREHIIQIAYEVGFNNKSTFNQAFKKMEGTTPSQFRKDLVARGMEIGKDL